MKVEVIMMKPTIRLEKDFVVIGGGLSGVCAAIAAARHGLKVALCHNRSVLGGNSSSECRVWVCGAVGMGFNRYASETGIISELLQENLYRNPQGNPHLWDALLLDKVWAEENIQLLLDTQMVAVQAENGRVLSVTCEQFNTETTFEFRAAQFADCTGDAVLVHMAGGDTVQGNNDVPLSDRERYCLDDHYASLGSTMLFYSKKTDQPVRFVAPSFAYTIEEMEEILQKNGKLLSPTDTGCDYWWLEYGGTLDVIKDHDAIRHTLTRLVYGVWNYIKNSGKYDAECMTLEWVGSMPARRECRRAIGRYTFTEQDIITHREMPDSVCHGGWPIDTHPSSGFFDKRESCLQIPIDPYGIPLSCLMSKDFDNVLLAGRDVGMTHVAMASARVMMTCAVEGQAIGTAAAFARRFDTIPSAFEADQINTLQSALTRDDLWIPGKRLNACCDLAQRMRVSATEALAADTGVAAGFYPLEQRAHVSLPPLPAGAKITLQLCADEKAAGKPYRVTLFESGRPEVYKPVLAVDTFDFSPVCGAQELCISLAKDLNGNVMIGLPPCEGLSIGYAAQPLPGVLGMWGENSLGELTFGPAVRVDGAALYSADALIDGYTRPYGGMHLFASKLDGCCITLEADEPITAQECVLYLDNALYRSYNNLRPKKDAVWHEFIHPALMRDFTVYAKGPDGEKTLRVQENVHRCVRLDLGGMKITQLRIVPEKTWGASFIAIHEIALFAPDSCC